MTVAESIDTIPVIDQHAHAIWPVDEDTSIETYAAYFSEGPSTDTARHTVNYRAAMSLLDEQFDTSDERSLFERRQSVSTETFTRRLLADKNLEAVIIDDGFPPGIELETFAEQFPAKVHPLLRLETLLESLIESNRTFDAVLEAYTERIDAALAGRYVGLKSIVAYRGGLALEAPNEAAARAAFGELLDGWTGRLENRVFLSYVLDRAAERAAAAGAPVQFHTGFGDADAHPTGVNPGHLFPYLKRHDETAIVLLHAGYPYVRTAGYIASVLPNVYLDLGLAIPFVQHGCRDVIRAALELTPTTKLLYSSDGCFVPERFVLGLDRIRSDLSAVLDGLVRDGFLTEAYAETVARNVLRETARTLYDL